MTSSTLDQQLAAELRRRTRAHHMGPEHIALATGIPLEVLADKWNGIDPLEHEELDRWCHFLIIDPTSLWLEIASGLAP